MKLLSTSSRNMKSIFIGLCLLVVAKAAPGHGNNNNHHDLIATLHTAGNFTIFTDLLEKSGLLTNLSQSSQFTVFAPTDEALARLPAGTIEALLNDSAKLTDFVATHLVLTVNDHIQGNHPDTVLRSANNHGIRINTYNILHTTTADGVNITIKNVPVLHGTLQGIDGVLVPPTVSSTQLAMNRPDLSNFTSLVTKANLLNYFTANNEGTYFIPSNDAISKLSPTALAYFEAHPADLAETIKYHIVRTLTVFSIGLEHSLTMTSADSNRDLLMSLEDGNGSTFINDAMIVEKDIITTDGVVHIIDKVLIPPHIQARIDDSAVVLG